MDNNSPVKSTEPYEIAVSFNRNPHEAVVIMFDASRRFSQTGAQEFTFGVWSVVIIAAGLLGIGMELYRRFVLPGFFNTQIFPTFFTAMAYFAPVFVFALMAWFFYFWSSRRAMRKGMIKRLAPHCIIDIDVTAVGIKVGTNDMVLFVPWKSIRRVAVAGKRIECDTETSVIYFPDRAFADHAAFQNAYKRMHLLWRRAIEAAMAVTETPK